VFVRRRRFTSGKLQGENFAAKQDARKTARTCEHPRSWTLLLPCGLTTPAQKTRERGSPLPRCSLTVIRGCSRRSDACAHDAIIIRGVYECFGENGVPLATTALHLASRHGSDEVSSTYKCQIYTSGLGSSLSLVRPSPDNTGALPRSCPPS
jgi:hypothetical protein